MEPTSSISNPNFAAGELACTACHHVGLNASQIDELQRVKNFPPKASPFQRVMTVDTGASACFVGADVPVLPGSIEKLVTPS